MFGGKLSSRSLSPHLIALLLCNGFLLSAQARPQYTKMAANDADHPTNWDDSPNNANQQLANSQPSDEGAGYVEPDSPSSSMLSHLSVPVQVAIIAGAIAGAILVLVLVAMTYLRHKVRVEVKEERRKTALRMSMMQEDLARRRKSQALILEALDRLRDDPAERPALPPRASQMPGAHLKVQQAGLLRNNSQISFASSNGASDNDEKRAEKRQSELEKTQRKLGFM